MERETKRKVKNQTIYWKFLLVLPIIGISPSLPGRPGSKIHLKPGSASPWHIGLLYILIFFGFFATGGILLFRWKGGNSLVFVSQMMFLIAAICLIPFISHQLTKRWGVMAYIFVESLLFIVLILGFNLWVFGTSNVGMWIGYVIVFILLLEIGASIVEWYKNITLKRFVRSNSQDNLQMYAKTFEKMFHNELILYISVPLGLLIGAIIGLIRNWSSKVTILLCLQLVFLLAAFLLLYFLVAAFQRMSNPMFETSQESSTEVIEEDSGSFFYQFRKVIKVFIPSQETSVGDHEQTDIDIAYMISDLRKMYLYNAVHNVILLIVFIAFALNLSGFIVKTKWLLSGLIGSSLIFNQLPYMIGQLRLHDRVLERFEGVKRSEIAEKLKKYAPFFPKVDFLSALFTAGTAGGVLYFLLDQFVKNTLK